MPDLEQARVGRDRLAGADLDDVADDRAGERWRAAGVPRAVASHLSARQPDEALERGLLDVVHGDAFANADWSRTQTMALLARLTEGLDSSMKDHGWI